MKNSKIYTYRADSFIIHSQLKGMKYVLYQFNTPKPEIVLMSDCYCTCERKKRIMISDMVSILQQYDPAINKYHFLNPYAVYEKLKNICSHPDYYYRIFKMEVIKE